MADDELSTPLGQNAKKETAAPDAADQPAAGDRGRCSALFILTFAGWALLVDDPLGGEPVAMVATGFDPPKGPAMPAVVSASVAQGPRSYDGPGSPQRQAAAAGSSRPRRSRTGTKTVTIIDGSTGKRQEVAIPGIARRRARRSSSACSKRSRHGAMPRIAPDGARPSDVYARPSSRSPAARTGPAIAIVIGGLGISASRHRAGDRASCPAR